MQFRFLFKLLLWVVFCLPLHFALAQKPSLSFQHLKLTTGYSETTTRFIGEDAWGYLWIGTDDGLNKYDGYTFTSYRNDFTNKYSISNNDNKEFLLDTKGNIWIATRNGLNLYDPVLDRFYNFHSQKHKCFTNLDGDIEGITEDEFNSIWITSGSDGLFKLSALDKVPENFVFNSESNAKKLYGITADGLGHLWVGTRDGLLRFNIETNTFEDMRPLFGLGYQVKNLLYEPEYNRLLLSTTEGIKVIDLTTNKMKEYKHDPRNSNSISGNNIIKVVRYNAQNYLIAVDGGGVDYFDLQQEKFYHYTTDNEGQLSANNVTYIYKDTKNNIWAGTFMNGVDFSNAQTNMFGMVKNNPLSESSLKKGIVTNFLNDKNGNLWVATDGGGLFVKKKNTEDYAPYNPTPSKYDFTSYPILTLALDKEGWIWAGTYGGGVVSFNPITGAIQQYVNNRKDPNSINNDNVRSIIVDRNNNVWINGFYSGVSVYNKKTNKFKHYRNELFEKNSLLSDWSQRVFEDSKGTIWLTTFKGLNRYNPDTDNFTSFQFKSPGYSQYACNHLLDMTEASDSNLWIGTIDAGIICFNRDDYSYKFYSVEQGLSSNSVKGVIEDENKNLWLATSNGVTKFNIVTKAAVRYTIQDGMTPFPFYFNSKFRDQKGKIYLGNSKGYLMINPEINDNNISVPPIVITGIDIFGKPLQEYYKNQDSTIHVSFLKEIRLNYSQNEIEIDYAALNFVNAQRNQYAYMLEGFDEGWRYVGSQRYAKYTNLNPGTYVFRVKGSNNDGVWNETGATIRIVIFPPWWKTWWFIVIEGLLLLAVLYLIYSLRIRNIRSKNAQLEHVVMSRTEELRLSNEQLEAFIYKASHDIKGPLRSIIGLTTVGQKDVSDETALVYFDHILKSTKKLDKLLADLLELTKVKEAKVVKEKINFRELINDSLAKFEHMEGYNKLNFTIMVKELTEFYSDKKLLNSIIQNLIENPIKYQDPLKENRYLDIVANVTDKYAELKFSDNGIGIPYEIQGRVFEMFFKASERSGDTGLGLHIVKTSVEKLNGHITLNSKPGVGSVFTVTFSL
jgi:two-component system, sensor histidine kinase ChiS